MAKMLEMKEHGTICDYYDFERRDVIMPAIKSASCTKIDVVVYFDTRKYYMVQYVTNTEDVDFGIIFEGDIVCAK